MAGGGEERGELVPEPVGEGRGGGVGRVGEVEIAGAHED